MADSNRTPQPLADNFPIVKEGGFPTEYFIRWAQERQIAIEDGITADQAQQLIEDWAAARDITAGVGLSGGGNLSADVNIDLENTAVTPGAYTSANLTVDAQGRITAAANGGGSSDFASVVFAGCTSAGATLTPPTILYSKNVASVVRLATGRYQINFTTNAPDPDALLPSFSAWFPPAASTASVEMCIDRNTSALSGLGLTAASCIITAAITTGSEPRRVAARFGQMPVPVLTPPTVRGYSSVWINNANNVHVPLPAGTVAGDTCVYFANHGWNVVAPAGFTVLDTSSGASTNGGCSYGILTATDITNGYVLGTFSNAYFGAAAIAVYQTSTVGSITLGNSVRNGASTGTIVLAGGTIFVGVEALFYAGARGNGNVTFAIGTKKTGVTNNEGSCGLAAFDPGAPTSYTDTATFVADPSGNYGAIVKVAGL